MKVSGGRKFLRDVNFKLTVLTMTARAWNRGMAQTMVNEIIKLKGHRNLNEDSLWRVVSKVKEQ